jgi:hypothetical protein
MNNFTMNSVAWTGSVWVAVGVEYDSSTLLWKRGVVLTSPDAKTWRDRDIGKIPNIFSIHWANNLLVAVGDSGSKLSSPDGIEWRVSNPGSNASYLGVLWADGQWVTFSENGSVEASTDGLHWVPHILSTNESLYSLTWTGTQFIALGKSHFFTSPDGISWALQDFPNVQAVFALVWMGDKLAMLSLFGAILTSPEDISIAIAKMHGTRDKMMVRFDAGRLFTELPESFQGQAVHFSIHDLRGNELRSGTAKSTERPLKIPATGMRNGWYVLKVKDASGGSGIAQSFRCLRE